MKKKTELQEKGQKCMFNFKSWKKDKNAKKSKEMFQIYQKNLEMSKKYIHPCANNTF